MFPSDSDFETEVTLRNETIPNIEEETFHILLLGNWSGKKRNFQQQSTVTSRPIEIDRDNFNEVMTKLNVKLELDLYNDGENLLFFDFTELDDFHPDNIFRQISLFSDLRDVRQRLLNANTYKNAAQEVRSWFSESNSVSVESTQTSTVRQETLNNSSSSLLDKILTQTEGNISDPVDQVTDSKELNKFIQKLVKPFVISVNEEEQSKMIAMVDEVISELMRAILHHSSFQAIESAWRGLYFLVSRIETHSKLKLFLLDISKEELSEDLSSSANLAGTNVFKWMIKDTVEVPGYEPWTFVCGNYDFSLDVEDAALLIRFAKIAKAADVPFISNFNPDIFGIESFGNIPENFNWRLPEDISVYKLWTTLQSLPESSHIAFAFTSFLGRVPYGKMTDPIETFNFEEFSQDFKHENYLWLNPSFACALLLAQGFGEAFINSNNYLLNKIDNLPVHIYKNNNETMFVGPLEAFITLSTSEKLSETGFITFLSEKNSDSISLFRMQSLSGKSLQV